MSMSQSKKGKCSRDELYLKSKMNGHLVLFCFYHFPQPPEAGWFVLDSCFITELAMRRHKKLKSLLIVLCFYFRSGDALSIGNPHSLP